MAFLCPLKCISGIPYLLWAKAHFKWIEVNGLNALCSDKSVFGICFWKSWLPCPLDSRGPVPTFKDVMLPSNSKLIKLIKSIYLWYLPYPCLFWVFLVHSSPFVFLCHFTLHYTNGEEIKLWPEHKQLTPVATKTNNVCFFLFTHCANSPYITTGI